MSNPLRNVLLLQLPIPPPGVVPVRGNVPLAAGYLKLLARNRGLESSYQIDIFPADLANGRCYQGLVSAILARDPCLVGFTCYLWNIERTLWVAQQLKAVRPDLLVVVGGPEITADNAWVLADPSIDYACIGEGEQTFSELLQALLKGPAVVGAIDGLYVTLASSRERSFAPSQGAGALEIVSAATSGTNLPAFRKPLAKLDEISSPYLAGILDASDEQMLLLETIRGCVFKCKFCYYPKSYDALYFLSRERLIANLEHARQCGAREVVLLDPTLNQRRDFAGFLRLLAECNPDRRFTYFGELRAEGINTEIARLLKEANFAEVEIGLQSIDPKAQAMMDRTNNLRAFERGARSMLDAGIKVKVDLIIGLPGDTVESIRRGFDYLLASQLYSSVQVFNLAILPGTAFRQEAAELGLEFQPRPPYYVTRTPTLELADMLELMEEAEAAFGVEFDPLPAPKLEFEPESGVLECVTVDLDRREDASGGLRGSDGLRGSEKLRAQAFTLWLQSTDFHARRQAAAALIARVLGDNPFTTLQVVLEPTGDPRSITPQCLDRLARACFANPTYLDKFYAVLPGRPKGAKRLIVVLPLHTRTELGADWIEMIGEFATLVWRGEEQAETELESHEYVVPADGLAILLDSGKMLDSSLSVS